MGGGNRLLCARIRRAYRNVNSVCLSSLMDGGRCREAMTTLLRLWTWKPHLRARIRRAYQRCEFRLVRAPDGRWVLSEVPTKRCALWSANRLLVRVFEGTYQQRKSVSALMDDGAVGSFGTTRYACGSVEYPQNKQNALALYYLFPGDVYRKQKAFP